jgi:hypothetical protein
VDIFRGDESRLHSYRVRPVAAADCRFFRHGLDEKAAPAAEAFESVRIALGQAIIRSGFDEKAVPEIYIFPKFLVQPI